MLLEKIKSLSAAFTTDALAIRHHLHAHPELSYQEFETSAYIQRQLTEIGIPFTVMATTGVVGLIEGINPLSRVIALRADIDALPIAEENQVPYKSRNEGIMHACGHDVHTTCLLGAARILHALKNEWGTVKLVTPGEEKQWRQYLDTEGVLEN
jgi:hippurate hydrolase